MDRSHRRYPNFPEVERTHYWLDAKGDVSNSFTDNYETFFGPIEVAGNTVYNIRSFCRNGFCYVQRLAVTEQGIDKEGWQTILEWQYPAGSGPVIKYAPARRSSSFLVVHKREPESEDKEWRIIIFSPESKKILAERNTVSPIGHR